MLAAVIFVILTVRYAIIRLWAAPDTGHRNRAGIGFVAEQRRIVVQATLLIHVCLYDLGGDARREIAMLALLDQHGNHNLRIAPGSHAGKPAIVFEFLAASAFALAQRVA